MDELIKQLRGCKDIEYCSDCPRMPNGLIEPCDIKEDAADAIERLTAQLPVWISVEERLPEHGVHVLAACLVKMFDGVGRYYVCDAFHTEHFTDTCNYDDDIDMEYNEEEDEYYMPPGWWEVIKNWDDYTCVAIEDHVTHWMPLPKAPEVVE